MATKAEVRDRALVDLGKLALGQSASNTLASDMEDSIDEVYEDLKNEGVTTWASTGNIPTELAPHVVVLAAYNRSAGASNERFVRLFGARLEKVINAKREIRRLTAPHYASSSAPTDF